MPEFEVSRHARGLEEQRRDFPQLATVSRHARGLEGACGTAPAQVVVSRHTRGLEVEHLPHRITPHPIPSRQPPDSSHRV